MDRRSFLKTTASAGALTTMGGIAAPAIAQGVKVLKFVPQANLANFDPIWASTYLVRNASQLVWDTPYGVDSTLTPKRQMVDSEEVSGDGLTWTLKLRSGLKFHDGTPVLAKDCVASITRWSARDPMQSATVFWSTDRSTLKADIARRPPASKRGRKALLPVDDQMSTIT